MEIKILSADKKIYEGHSNKITFPGIYGEFQILENHAPLISLLKRGKIIIGNKEKEIKISAGIVEVKNKKVIALIK